MMKSLAKMRSVVLGSALAGSSLLLAACGSDPMSSYDAEKSRIRGALPGSVACTDGPETGGMPGAVRMACQSGPFELRLVKLPTGQNSAGELTLNVTYQEFLGGTPQLGQAFEKLMAAYEFDASDIQRCANSRSHRKQGKTFSVSCQNFARSGPRDFSVIIKQERAV